MQTRAKTPKDVKPALFSIHVDAAKPATSVEGMPIANTHPRYSAPGLTSRAAIIAPLGDILGVGGLLDWISVLAASNSRSHSSSAQRWPSVRRSISAFV